MKKYVLSVEEVGVNLEPKFVYSASTIDEVRTYISLKYQNAKKTYPTSEELFKLHIVEKYLFNFQRTKVLQSQFILRIKCLVLDEEDYDEEKENCKQVHCWREWANY